MMDISVIIPVYNAEQYLEEAISSVLEQQFDGDIEVLIADDCSTDGSARIIAKFAIDYPQIIRAFYNKENLGCSLNYFSLVKKAKGRYLAFCDADDYWIGKSKLQRQYTLLENNPDIGMCCMADPIFRKDSTTLGLTEEQGFFLEFNDLMLSSGDILNSSILCHRDLFEKMTEGATWFIQNNCYFDSIWAYWFSRYSKIWCMKDAVAYYRVLSDSDCHSTDPRKRFLLDKRYYQNKVRFLLSNSNDNELLFKVLNNEYDSLYSRAHWDGESSVRKSKAYKLGRVLLHPKHLFSK